MSAAVEIDGLTKDYAVGFWRRRPYRALDQLTLSIAPGEVFGFLGPNGAGKTTTLKLLMQLIYPTAGRAEILGRPVGDLAMRRRIGYLPENPYFYDYLTAEELLTYFARLLDVPAADTTRAACRALLDRVGIGRERRFQLRKFSKGMIQRVGIAQALLNDPEVVFLDEPMSGLDPLGRRDVRALILELRDRGRTVFFSSHILADAEALCSRVAIVAGGRLAALGRLAELAEFEVRGWELVVVGSARRRARARPLPGEPRRRDRAGPLRAGTAAVAGPRADGARDRGDRRHGGVDEPAARHARGLLRPAHRGGRRPRAGGRTAMRAVSAIALNVFRESVRDRVLYNLVLFAVLLIGSSYLLASSPPARTSRSSRTWGWRRPRSSACSSPSSSGSAWSRRRSSGAASTRCSPSRSAVRSSSLGKYAGLVLTLAVNVAVMTTGAVCGAGLHDVDGERGVQGRRGRRPASIRRC